MAAYATGDCHGDFEKIIQFIVKHNLNENDSIYIMGDMGLYWNDDMKEAQLIMDLYEKSFKTHIYFIDGNHENFNLLEKLPDEAGTSFKRCSDHIHYIPRGTIFNIGDKVCLACGGADSVDKFRRRAGYTWWEQEQITDADIEKCIDNAKGKHIDYVFTHCAPLSMFKEYAPWLLTILGLDEKFINHTSEEKLDVLMNNIDFGEWIFGHYHVDKVCNDKFRCLLNDFIEL